jgi:hypothetical protein
MWFYCQPAAASLALLSEICAGATDPSTGEALYGAPLLNLLEDLAGQLAGDKESQAVLMRLLKASAVPYCRALERWLYEGQYVP